MEIFFEQISDYWENRISKTGKDKSWSVRTLPIYQTRNYL